MFQPGVLFLGEEQGDNDTAELVHHQESHRRSLLPPKGQKCGLRDRPRHFQNVQVCSYITKTAILFRKEITFLFSVTLLRSEKNAIKYAATSQPSFTTPHSSMRIR